METYVFTSNSLIKIQIMGLKILINRIINYLKKEILRMGKYQTLIHNEVS